MNVTHRLSWLMILLSGIVAYWLVLFTMIATKNVVLFPTLLIVGALSVPLTVLTWLDRRGPEPIVPGTALAGVAAVGGVVGVLFASVLESMLATPSGGAPPLGVAIIEESIKVAVPIGLLLVGVAPRRDAGGVIGVAAGAGFAVLETMGYAFAVLLETGSLAAADQTLLLRGIFAPACHIAWTGMVVAVAWRARYSAGRGWWGAATIGPFIGVIVLHTAWDAFAATLTTHLVIALISLTGLLLATRREVPHA